VEQALSEPFLLMIAGPNGAGKTTLTQHLLSKDIDLGEYINPDDIAAGLDGSLAERTKQAQLIADRRRDECIRAKGSFSFETVMSHPSKIEVLVRAKEAGYTVLLYFVGTDDPQTNIERVALRVALGGHPVPDDKVRDRWLRTMVLLQQAIRSSDRAYIFDNNVAKSWRHEAGKDRGEAEAIGGGVVGFFSLEMSSEQIATRIISQQSGIPMGVIRRGAITERDFETIRNHSIEFQMLPLFIDETTALSMEQLASRAHRLKSSKGLDLLIIDNLELLRVAARTNFGETKISSLQITRELKKLAKDLGIPVLVLTQLPSKIEKRQDRRPRIEELGDKGVIEQDADVIMFLHRDDFYLLKDEPWPGSHEYSDWIRQVELAHGKAELIIIKQRNGATGTIELSFDPSIGSFSDLSF
jgi:predicted ABC-type ATPase